MRGMCEFLDLGPGKVLPYPRSEIDLCRQKVEVGVLHGLPDNSMLEHRDGVRSSRIALLIFQRKRLADPLDRPEHRLGLAAGGMGGKRAHARNMLFGNYERVAAVGYLAESGRHIPIAKVSDKTFADLAHIAKNAVAIHVVLISRFNCLNPS